LHGKGPAVLVHLGKLIAGKMRVDGVLHAVWHPGNDLEDRAFDPLTQLTVLVIFFILTILAAVRFRNTAERTA